jgi:hypothetical protein
MWKFLHRLASPPHFYHIAVNLIPWFAMPGLLLLAYGTYAGLFVAPPDYQQGDAFRIIYVHAPAAYLSMMAYMIMAISAGIGLIWRIKLAHAVAAAVAPLGAWFTFLALATAVGALIDRFTGRARPESRCAPAGLPPQRRDYRRGSVIRPAVARRCRGRGRGEGRCESQ